MCVSFGPIVPVFMVHTHTHTHTHTKYQQHTHTQHQQHTHIHTHTRTPFTDNFIRFRPNTFTSVMQVVVDILLFLYAIGTPFTLVEIPGCECFQIWTILAVFLLVFPIITSHSMVTILADPFSNINSAHDIFNFDTLIVSSEQTIFASLRGGFDQAHIREEKECNPLRAIKTKKKTSPRGTVDAMDLRHRPQIN